MPYAADTTVPVERSRAELEKLLARFGATAFSFGWSGDEAAIMFQAQGRTVRFRLGLGGDEQMTQRQFEQNIRSRWRALVLVVKAKLVAVEAGIVTFEEEFLAHIVLPDGRDTYEWMRPQLEESYSTGRMPVVLPQLGDGR